MNSTPGSIADIVGPAAPPPRRRRWPKVIGVTLVIAVFGWWLVVPFVVQNRIAAALRAAGFERVAIGSVAVGTSRVELRGLQVLDGDDGDAEFTIATAAAEFTVGGLLSGAVEVLTLDGVVWTRSPRPDRATAPFGELLRRRAAAPPAADAAGAALPDVPLQHLRVTNARIAPRAGAADDRVDFDGSLERAGRTWRVAANARVAARVITVAATVAADGDDLVADVMADVTGADQAAATLRVRRTRGGEFVVGCEHARVALQSGVALEGVAADVRVRGTPPATIEPQTLRWHTLRVGSVAAGTGEAAFELHGTQVRARVTQRTADAAGWIEVDGLRWAPGTNEFPLALDAHDVPLREWLELASSGHVSGDGVLNGHLAFVVRTEPRLSIAWRDGRLTAKPGGIVRFLEDPDTDAIVRQHVQQIAASTGHDALVQDRLLNALREFRYSRLEFAVEPDASGRDATLGVHLAGEGAAVAQQVDMDVDLHGFGSALDAALALKLGLDRARERLDHEGESAPRGPGKEK